MKCPECKCEFDPADRASPTALEGLNKSAACARKAENRRYYQAHKEKIKARVIDNQKRK